MFLYENFGIFFYLFDLMSEFCLLESGGREKEIINVSKQKMKANKKMFLLLTFTLVSLQEGGGKGPKCM